MAKKNIGTLAMLLTADGAGLAREFKRADNVVARSTTRWQSQLKGGLKLGLGVVGAQGIVSALTHEIRHVVDNIESIPGVPQDAIDSIARLRGDFEEARGVVDGFIASGIVGFANFAKGIGYAAAALREGFSMFGLSGFLPGNFGATFAAGLGKVAADAPAAVPPGERPLTGKQSDKVDKALKDFFEPLDAASNKQQDKLAAAAESIFEKTRTPLEKFAEQMRELGNLLDRRLINGETFVRATEQYRADLNGQGIKPERREVDALQRMGLLVNGRGGAGAGLEGEEKKHTSLLTEIRDALTRNQPRPLTTGGLEIY